MESIERKSDGKRIGGLSGDAGREIRVDPRFIWGADVEECTVESVGEAWLEQ